MCLQKACDLAHSHLEGTAPEALSTLNETCAELRLVRALCPPPLLRVVSCAGGGG
jgi:hypothetical protein